MSADMSLAYPHILNHTASVETGCSKGGLVPSLEPLGWQLVGRPPCRGEVVNVFES